MVRTDDIRKIQVARKTVLSKMARGGVIDETLRHSTARDRCILVIVKIKHRLCRPSSKSVRMAFGLYGDW